MPRRVSNRQRLVHLLGIVEVLLRQQLGDLVVRGSCFDLAVRKW